MKILCKEACKADKPQHKGKGWSLVTGVLVLLMPKCAFCWAAYMSLLSSFGIVIKYQSWFLPFSVVLFLLTLIKLLIRSFQGRSFFAFVLALGAAIIIISQRSVPGIDWIKALAITMMTVAVLEEKILQVIQLVFAQLRQHIRARV
jgi:mercuric ion transport protein